MPTITERSPIAFADALPEAVDVAIVGAGIAGTATAYFLARHGTKVLLCEKGRVAGEQSSRNWGWVRQQGRDRAELPIMMEANRIWRGLAAETGEADLAFTASGCIYLIDDQAQLGKHEGWHELAKQHQLDTAMLTKEEVAARFPGLGGDWIAAMVTATDGRAEPSVAVPALARAARGSGAIVIEDCAVRALDVSAGRVAGVVTERGRVRCDRVLLAAGVWSSHFAANAGVDLPQLAVRSTAARTEPAPAAPYENNLSTPGLALRRRADGGYTVATGDGADHYLSPDSFKYFVKFLKVMRTSDKDVHLHPAAPQGLSRRLGHAAPLVGRCREPVRAHARARPGAFAARRQAHRRPPAPALSRAGRRQARRGLGRHDRRDARRGAHPRRGTRFAGALPRDRPERPTASASARRSAASWPTC